MRARRVPWGLVRGEVNGYYVATRVVAKIYRPFFICNKPKARGGGAPPAPRPPPAGGARPRRKPERERESKRNFVRGTINYNTLTLNQKYMNQI